MKGLEFSLYKASINGVHNHFALIKVIKKFEGPNCLITFKQTFSLILQHNLVMNVISLNLKTICEIAKVYLDWVFQQLS